MMIQYIPVDCVTKNAHISTIFTSCWTSQGNLVPFHRRRRHEGFGPPVPIFLLPGELQDPDGLDLVVGHPVASVNRRFKMC